MSKIKLTQTELEQVEISSNPIIIVDTKKRKGYKTTKGFVGLGGIFTSVYNELIDSLNETTPATPSYIFDYFQGVSMSEIADYLQSGVLSSSLREKIKTDTKTLAFRVGIYKGKPTLYYVGFEEYLFIYDLLMIQQHHIKIKLCKDCGRAFVPHTKGEYCPLCQNIVIRNRAKYQTLKNDPARLMFTRLQQRIQKREKTASAYRTLFEKLAANNKETEWLKKWSELDKRYQKIKKQCMEYDFSLTETRWNDSIKTAHISSIDEFRQWLDKQENPDSVIKESV